MTSASATVTLMVARHASQSDVVAYLGSLVRKELETSTAREIARRAKMSHVTILNFAHEDVQAGKWDTIMKLAVALKRDPDNLHAEAAQYVRENPPPPKPAEDCYPNRAKAVEAARLVECDPRAVDRVMKVPPGKCDPDPSPRQWFRWIAEEEARLRLMTKTPDDSHGLVLLHDI